MNDTCILGLHIAKIGGTSILYNLSTHVDQDAYFNYGPHSNVARFFKGQPTLGEMEDKKLKKLKFVFGHGVNERLLRALPHKNLALFCVYWDPYEHMLSQYKHRIRMSALKGNSITVETFLERRQNNPASHFLVTHFPTLAGEGDLRTRSHNVLKHFRFVLSTDNLTQQSVGLFRLAGVPPITAKRRVYPESVEIPGLSRDDVYAANAVDYEINQAINAIEQDPEQADTWNPIGYDPEALIAARDQIRQKISADDQRKHSFKMVARQVRQLQSVLAAQEYARQSRVTPDLASTLEALPPPLSNAAGAQSAEQTNLARILHKGGKSQDAIVALEKAIELNNNNANAYFLLSRIYLDLHNKRILFKEHETLAKSLTMAEEALKRSPARGDIAALLGDICLARKDRNGAIVHYKKAIELAPDNEIFSRKYAKINTATS